jgi:hypothetical protein
MTLFEGFVVFMLLGISGRLYMIGNSIRADIGEIKERMKNE